KHFEDLGEHGETREHDNWISPKIQAVEVKSSPSTVKPVHSDLQNSKRTGEETLVVDGRSIRCRWELSSQFFKSTGTWSPESIVTTKTWTSDDVPGGLVRLLEETRGRQSLRYQETKLVEFEAVAVAAEAKPHRSP